MTTSELTQGRSTKAPVINLPTVLLMPITEMMKLARSGDKIINYSNQMIGQKRSIVNVGSRVYWLSRVKHALYSIFIDFMNDINR